MCDLPRARGRAEMYYAGIWKRLGAYTVDVIPITLLIAALFYFFLGFDDAVKARFSNPSDIRDRIEFLRQRNQIRDLSFVFLLIYSMIMEASPLRGTFGKYLFRIEVVDQDGRRLTARRSIQRNVATRIPGTPQKPWLFRLGLDSISRHCHVWTPFWRLRRALAVRFPLRQSG